MAKNPPRGEARTIFRPNFGNCAELPLYEKWFSDMAVEGRHLLSWGTWFCRFAERNPKQMQYRIDLCEKVVGAPRNPPVHEGWSFVCRRDDAFVYRSEPKLMQKTLTAGEKATDDGQNMFDENGLPKFVFDPRRRFTSLNAQNKLVTALALLLWSLGLLTVLLGCINFSWHAFLTGSFGYFCAASVFGASAVFLTIESVRLQHIYYLYKTRQEEREPNWRASRRVSYISALVCVVLLAASVILLVIQGASANAGTLPFQPSATLAPLPWLESIDGEMQRVPARNPSAKYNYDTNNFIATKWSLFAPKQYSARQCGESQDGNYHPVLESESITTLSLFTATELFEEVAVAPKGWSQALAIEGGGHTDQLRLYTNEYGEYYLAARNEKTVLIVKYHGTAEQTTLLEAVNTAIFQP